MSALNGEVIVADQGIGEPVQLVTFGDEFYARKETLDGYSVVYDTQKRQYCYAALAAGRFVSSGIPLYKARPANLRKHLKEDPAIRNSKFEQRYRHLRPPENQGNPAIMRTFGPEDGLLSGRKLHQGNVRGLTILVDFDDIRSNISPQDVDAMFNADNYNQNGNYCSVKTYFEIVSTGKLHYTNLVVGPVRLSKRRSHYINNLMVEEVMDKVVHDLNIDLRQLDSKREGIVDAINFLYAGESQYDGDLWPHNHFTTLRYGNMRTHYYQLTGLGEHTVDLRIGTICHENGHLLCRFPDMYDYGERDGDFEKSQGIGRFCLMGSGNHLNQRRTPAPVCGYLRDLAGWVDQVIDVGVPGNYQAEQGKYDIIMKYRTDKANEYFVLENRTRQGLDAHLPSSGLAVLHCDTLGSNELQDGTRNAHYQCALLQADGHLDLENNRNAGDASDLFQQQSGLVLSDTTVPSSREWDDTDSGLQLFDVSEPGPVIEFRVGQVATPDNLHLESSPNAIIPDNNPAGVSNSLNVSQSGDITGVTVGVEIIHSWISDLKVRLKAPGGEIVMLHDRHGNNGDDIFKSWSSGDFPGLADLHGTPAQGDWTLHVQDYASADVGRLLRWTMDLSLTASAGGIVENMAIPNMAIPDNRRQGITSALNMSQPGNVTDIVVSVDIEHSYIGDLQVELVAPSGKTVLLHNKTGGSSNDIVRDFDRANSPVLAEFIGEPIKGDWGLRVRDLARLDTGTLNNWKLTLSY